MLILNFAGRAQIVSRDLRNDLANLPEIKDSRIFACEDCRRVRRRALISPVILPVCISTLSYHHHHHPAFSSLGMHESISCAVACRKSNIHGVAIGTNANERGDSSISLLDNPSSAPSAVPSFFFLPSVRFSTERLIVPIAPLSHP